MPTHRPKPEAQYQRNQQIPKRVCRAASAQVLETSTTRGGGASSPAYERRGTTSASPVAPASAARECGSTLARRHRRVLGGSRDLPPPRSRRSTHTQRGARTRRGLVQELRDIAAVAADAADDDHAVDLAEQRERIGDRRERRGIDHDQAAVVRGRCVPTVRGRVLPL